MNINTVHPNKIITFLIEKDVKKAEIIKITGKTTKKNFNSAKAEISSDKIHFAKHGIAASLLSIYASSVLHVVIDKYTIKYPLHPFTVPKIPPILS